MRLTRQRGIALVAVLWLIALISLLAMAVVAMTVTHQRTAERYVEAVQADLTADSALRVVLLHLITPAEYALASAMNSDSLTIFESTVHVTIEREAGRIDLNTADPDLLFALFAANGWTEQEAHSMVARILDWRDADDETREGGAESREYRSAGLSYEPRNADFESADELRQVLGSERLSPGLLDAFTVFTHSTGSMESVAPPPVKRAFAWADERKWGGHPWLHQQAGGVATVSAEGSQISLIGEVLRVRACAVPRHGGETRCRRVIVRLTGSESHPLQVFDWRTVS